MSNAYRDENSVPTKIALSSLNGTTIDRVKVNPTNHALKVNLAPDLSNGDFSSQPAFTAPTSTFGRWIDGTATGSLTDSSHFWGVAQTTSGTGSAQFDNVGGVNCITIVATGLTKSGGSAGQIGFTNIRDYAGPSINAYNSPYLIPVIAGVSYNITGNYYIQSCSDTSNVATYIKVIFYQSNGITRVSTTSTDSKLGTILNTWLPATNNTFTAPANSAYVALGGTVPTVGANGTNRAMTVSWSNLSITPTIPSVSGNAKRDENEVPVLLAVSSVDGITPVELFTDGNGSLLVDSN